MVLKVKGNHLLVTVKKPSGIEQTEYFYVSDDPFETGKQRPKPPGILPAAQDSLAPLPVPHAQFRVLMADGTYETIMYMESDPTSPFFFLIDVSGDPVSFRTYHKEVDGKLFNLVKKALGPGGTKEVALADFRPFTTSKYFGDRQSDA
jgi:hypothetical protein